MDGKWLIEQEIDIKMDKVKNKKLKETTTMIKLMALVGFISLLSYANAETVFNCPHCEKPIEIRTWGETWICPNKKCGYENYDGIDYCGICGTWRYQKD